jgi:hypothetical protein
VLLLLLFAIAGKEAIANAAAKPAAIIVPVNFLVFIIVPFNKMVISVSNEFSVEQIYRITSYWGT